MIDHCRCLEHTSAYGRQNLVHHNNHQQQTTKTDSYTVAAPLVGIPINGIICWEMRPRYGQLSRLGSWRLSYHRSLADVLHAPSGFRGQ